VVGGAGFLGSHLVDHLIEDRGCDVTVVDNLIVGRLEFVHKQATFVHADITQSENYLKSIFLKNKIRYVMNYAARPYVPDSYARPLRTFDVNAMGALQVINAAQEAGVEAILQVSSAEIYGEGRYLGPESLPGDKELSLKEDSPVCPHSSYGAAKAAIDAMVQVRWREAKTPCIALRQFNCCGERESHLYVIPEIISQLWPISCQPYLVSTGLTGIVKLGNNSFRDFLYAGDQARMATELLEKGQFGEVYNLGSETGVKIYDLASMLGRIMGFTEVKVEQDPTRVRPWEIWSLLSDNSKIYSVIEARPTVGLDEALRRTVAYYRENGNKWCWEK
jgi:nucleoside-diphosphate-sugar epimerase